MRFKIKTNTTMKLEQQVLSLEQIKELRELGFDVRKHSSIYYVPNWEIKWGEYEIQDYNLVIGELREEDIDCIPTLTIGDIIECLPVEIEEEILNIFAFGKTWSVGWEGIHYWGSNTLIDALFETLKWCIKQKHIAL